jgi:polysaccharide export outer membrane protein
MRARNWLLAILICSLCPFARAQSDSLLIGPGDLIHVQVFNTPELDQHPRVSESGDVPLEFLGNVHVSGLTPAQAAGEIESKLIAAKMVLHPQVTVNVDQFATQTVSVLGEVHQPGTFQITAPRSVIDVLAMAGGLTSSADRHITIKRQDPDGKKISYYLSNDANAAFDKSMLVYPGDSILVSKAGLVYVLGDVGKPGGYVMDDNQSQLTALQMIAQAGGMNKTAVPAHVRLIRKDADGGFSETRLQIAKMQKGKEADVELEPGDIVYVPFSYMKGVGLGAAGIAASVSGAAVETHP